MPAMDAIRAGDASFGSGVGCASRQREAVAVGQIEQIARVKRRPRLLFDKQTLVPERSNALQQRARVCRECSSDERLSA